MVRHAGVVRPDDALEATLTELAGSEGPELRHAAWVMTNLHTIAVAFRRCSPAAGGESRCHRRSDIDHLTITCAAGSSPLALREGLPWRGATRSPTPNCTTGGPRHTPRST